MKRLEDKIRDRLEGYESSLPEGDLSEFKAILDAGTKGASKRRKVSPVAWLAPIAAAAAVALFFFLGNNQPQPDAPTATSTVTPTTAKNDAPEAAAPTGNDTTHNVSLPVAVTLNVPQHTYAQAVPGDVEHGDSIPQSTPVELELELPDQKFAMAETVTTLESLDSVSTIAADDTTVLLAATAMPDIFTDNPQQPKRHRTFSFKTTAGIVGGAGGAAALIKYLPSIGSAHLLSVNGDASPGNSGAYSVTTRYYMPLRAGVSLRVPLSNRWSLTSGVDFSVYFSKTFSESGSKSYNVQYIGIPLRADYTLLRRKKLELYLGAGIAADFCVSVHLNGNYPKDGVGFALVGAGGVQLNLSKNIGLYLEPTVSWNLPDKNRLLVTYKSLHPVSFSVSPGLRFTLDN